AGPGGRGLFDVGPALLLVEGHRGGAGVRAQGSGGEVGGVPPWRAGAVSVAAAGWVLDSTAVTSAARGSDRLDGRHLGHDLLQGDQDALLHRVRRGGAVVAGPDESDAHDAAPADADGPPVAATRAAVRPQPREPR